MKSDAEHKLDERVREVGWLSATLLEAHVQHTKIAKVDGEAVAQAIRVADLHWRLMERFERELKGEKPSAPEAA